MRTYRSAILLTFALGLGLYVAFQLRHILLLIYISILFAAVLAPAVDRVRQARIAGWHPSSGVAILVIFGATLAVLTVFLVFALPPIFKDAQALASDLPRRLAQLLEQARRLPFNGQFDETQLQRYAADLVGGVFGFFKGVASFFVVLVSWLILTAYFVIDGRRAFDWALSLFPPEGRGRLGETLLRAQDRMRHWLVGQGVLMLVLGSYSLIIFTLLDVKYPLALAVFAGLANFIPILGPIITIILASLVAAVDSFTKVLAVLAAFLLYQQIENAYLTPRVMESAVKLRPLAVVIAAGLGGTLAGVLGALVAVPSAAIAAVFIDEYLVHKDDELPPLAVPEAGTAAQTETLRTPTLHG